MVVVVGVKVAVIVEIEELIQVWVGVIGPPHVSGRFVRLTWLLP